MFVADFEIALVLPEHLVFLGVGLRIRCGCGRGRNGLLADIAVINLNGLVADHPILRFSAFDNRQIQFRALGFVILQLFFVASLPDLSVVFVFDTVQIGGKRSTRRRERPDVHVEQLDLVALFDDAFDDLLLASPFMKTRFR